MDCRVPRGVKATGDAWNPLRCVELAAGKGEAPVSVEARVIAQEINWVVF